MAEFITFQPRDNFKTLQFTGTGASNAQTFPETTAMQPDLVWCKNEDDGSGSGTYGTNHMWVDSVRGATKYIESNEQTASTTDANSLTAFGSDGFTVGSLANCNQSGSEIMSYNFKAGTTTGIAGSPSITPSSYSFNATSGFSIIAWTGTGVAGTLPHGLGVKPTFIIVKKLNGATNWMVYHVGSTVSSGGTDPQTDYLNLNDNGATADNDTIWNDTAPTTDLFSVGSNDDVNGNTNTYIAYVFTDVKGMQKFGRYYGNGDADGPCILSLGFRPGFFIIKKCSGAGSWDMYTDKINPFNTYQLWKQFFADENYNLGDYTTADCDLLSNGFKLRTSNVDRNSSNQDYIYMAWAEFPMVSSNNIPGVAR